MPKVVNRGRDYAAMLDKHGFEGGTRKFVYKLAEDNEMLRQELSDAIQALGALIALTRNLTQGTAAIQQSVEKIEQKFHPNNEANPEQSWEQ